MPSNSIIEYTIFPDVDLKFLNANQTSGKISMCPTQITSDDITLLEEGEVSINRVITITLANDNVYIYPRGTVGIIDNDNDMNLIKIESEPLLISKGTTKGGRRKSRRNKKTIHKRKRRVSRRN
jgi:pyruvate carboxylase